MECGSRRRVVNFKLVCNMNSNIFLSIAISVVAPLAAQGVFPGPAGTPGSTAISKDSAAFVNWANGHSAYVLGTDVDATWRTPEKAYGKAIGGSFEIVCLGNGGSITMFFPLPISDGVGADFAVFENAFSDTFLELAFVEVSSNGVDFFRFPTTSLTPSAVGPFAAVEPEEIDGFAGKYRAGFGTPFDLAVLPASALLDRRNIRYVRVIDIIGDGSRKDQGGRSIYDPTPTVGSGGFDLDAIGVLHQNGSSSITMVQSGLEAQGFFMKWESNPGSSYRIETSTTLLEWQTVETLQGASGSTTEKFFPVGADTRRFWRVIRP
jgi:hypothetical protein